MSALETIYDYFEDHSKATAYVNEVRPVIFGIVCFALGGVSLFVAQAMANLLHFLTFNVSSLCLTLLWEVVTGFLLAAVLHLILDIEGVKGSAVGLFILLGMANLIWALTVPFVFISRLLLPDKPWATTLIFLLVGLMSVSLKARSLRDNYHITSARAWVTLGLPYLAILVVVLTALSLAVWITLLKLVQFSG